jgi:hypothetical protein
MRRLLFAIVTFYSTISFGQDLSKIEQRLDAFKDSLKHNNIDTFLIYILGCAGCAYPADTCNYFDARYLFWKNNGNTFIRKFEGCKIYRTLMLDSSNPLTFYFTQKKIIDTEVIQIPSYVESQKGNKMTLIGQTIDHTCYYEMTFLIKTKKVYKQVSDYDLTFTTFDNGKKNIYLDYNQSTQTKKLIDQTTELIKQLNTDNKFDGR